MLFTYNSNKQRSLLCIILFIIAISVNAQHKNPDAKAAEIEKQLTDEERFQLLYSILGNVPSIGMPRDPRIPEGVSMSAGYTPGIPRLGIPAIQSSDASMGVYQPWL